MNPVQLILYVAAISVPSSRVSLGWAGMACWLAATVFVPLLA